MKIAKKTLFLLFFVLNLFFSYLFSNENNDLGSPFWLSNREILNLFFKNLFENTTAGYVIYGEKPVYLGSFCRPEWLMPGSSKHEEAIQTFLALSILKDYAKYSKSANYILLTPRLKDISSHNNSFIIINRKAFFKVVKENLALFKYKFGHDLTPENLLDKFIKFDDEFLKLFNDEIAIQGIILGYGTNNSIAYERASVFTKIVTSNTPFSPPNKLSPAPKTEEEMISRIENSFEEGLWKKVKEETEDFSYYHSQDPHDLLKIPFSFHKNSVETKILLKKYRKAQNNLNRILSRKNFLDHVLKDLQLVVLPRSSLHPLCPGFLCRLFFKNRSHCQLDKERFLKNSQCWKDGSRGVGNFWERPLDPQILQNSPENINEQLYYRKQKFLSQLLARSIQYTFSEQISPEFIRGIRAAAQDISKDILDIDKELEFFEVLREQKFSSNNRKIKSQESQSFFEEVASRQDIRCLVPNRLYVYILKNGIPGKSLTLKNKYIRAHYLIKDMNGHPILGAYKGEEPAQVNLEKLIPGFAYGILGMEEGEIRDVYIHPDFTYGTYSTFGEGNAIQIQIKLIKIEDNTETIEPNFLQPIDVMHLTPTIESCEEFVNLQKKYNYFCGMKTWLHYKKLEPLIHLNLFIDQLMSNYLHPLSDQERELISRLDWTIYQK